MRIYICADIEGVAGVVDIDQLQPSGSGHAEARRLMTDEVLAAIEGARAAGAGEIVVADSHGNGRNLLIPDFPDAVELVQGWPRPLVMMQGIEQGRFDGMLFIGHHAGAGSTDGVLAHTMSGRLIADVTVNGESWSETDLNAAIAAHFGVPVLLATGDDAYTGHVQHILPGTATVTTKAAFGASSARSLTPAASRAKIRAAAEQAVRALPSAEVSALPQAPLEVELTLKRRQAAELLAYLPIVERAAAHTVRFRPGDVLELNAMLYFVAAYDPKGALF
jgi:D-amino peptidase